MCKLDEECKEMISKISRLCKQRHITPHALAIKAGLSTSTISYLLSGRTKPQVYTILQICDVLGISICDLFDEDMSCEKKHISLEEEELLSDFRELSDKKKMLLRVYMEMLLEVGEEILI